MRQTRPKKPTLLGWLERMARRRIPQKKKGTAKGHKSQHCPPLRFSCTRQTSKNPSPPHGRCWHLTPIQPLNSCPVFQPQRAEANLGRKSAQLALADFCCNPARKDLVRRRVHEAAPATTESKGIVRPSGEGGGGPFEMHGLMSKTSQPSYRTGRPSPNPAAQFAFLRRPQSHGRKADNTRPWQNHTAHHATAAQWISMGKKGHPFLVGSATLLKTPPPPPIGVSGAHILAEAKNQAVPLRGRAKHELNPFWLVEFKGEPFPTKNAKRAPLGHWDASALKLTFPFRGLSLGFRSKCLASIYASSPGKRK